MSGPQPTVAIKVLIVDDSELLVTSLARILEREADMEVVGCARSERDALIIAADHVADVVVMDYRLGESDGIRVAERIRKIQPAVRVLLLSGDVTDSYMLGRARVARLNGVVAKNGDLAGSLPVAIRRANDGGLGLAGSPEDGASSR